MYILYYTILINVNRYFIDKPNFGKFEKSFISYHRERSRTILQIRNEEDSRYWLSSYLVRQRRTFWNPLLENVLKVDAKLAKLGFALGLEAQVEGHHVVEFRS
jgi:hypothetical protein